MFLPQLGEPHPVLRFMQVSVAREAGLVRAGLFGLVGGGLAVYRSGDGCTVLPDGKPALGARARAAPARAAAAGSLDSRTWPDGDRVATDAAIHRLIGDDGLAGSGARAIVVVHRGRILAERYAAGFSAERTPLLGWSMTKTVTAGLIGLLVKDGRLTLEQSALWPAAPGDARDRITIADLLAMSSGLHFDESYGAVSMSRACSTWNPTWPRSRARAARSPAGIVLELFESNRDLLARIFQDAAGDGALDFVRERLFVPLGMDSATIETDAHGTLVGSSYMYAVARDWARYGQFLLRGRFGADKPCCRRASSR